MSCPLVSAHTPLLTEKRLRLYRLLHFNIREFNLPSSSRAAVVKVYSSTKGSLRSLDCAIYIHYSEIEFIGGTI